MAVHADTQGIAPHIAYEYERVHQDARELQRLVGTAGSSGPPPTPTATSTGVDQERINRAVESLLLHARVVYDFFFVPPRKKCPDVSVSHFFDVGHEWSPDPAVFCPYLHTERERLNRSIPHLSYDRLSYDPGTPWNIQRIVMELSGVWTEFLRRLPPDRRERFTRPTVQHPSSVLRNLCAKTAPTITDVRTF